MNPLVRPFFVLAAALLLPARSPAQPAAAPSSVAASIPAMPREMRGVWITTVGNSDWPSKPGLPVAQQRAELSKLLARAQSLRLTSVFLQVNTGCDAFYPSRVNPWSHYLTGVQGRAPSPAWDPLREAINEAHARGLELHAWMNPFRCSIAPAFAPGNIAVRQPNLVRAYGSKRWLDPGEAAARAHSLASVQELVTNYPDLDGVHFDDYFYPYQEKDKNDKLLPFPDQESFGAYVASGGKLPLADWRRASVDDYVQRAHAICAAAPGITFGISPFGIYKPGAPAGVAGLSAYDVLYADAKKWVEQGWVDYIAPQLYWKPTAPQQPFAPLLAWWSGLRLDNQVLVFAGLFTSKITEPKGPWAPEEILTQIQLTRAQPRAAGTIHFRMRTLDRNSGNIASLLAGGPYATWCLSPLRANRPAIVSMAGAPPAVQLAVGAPSAAGLSLQWGLAPGGRPDQVRRYAVYVRRGGRWSADVTGSATTQYMIPAATLAAGPPLEAVAVSAVNRANIEGPRTVEIISRAGEPLKTAGGR